MGKHFWRNILLSLSCLLVHSIGTGWTGKQQTPFYDLKNDFVPGIIANIRKVIHTE